ncbi:MAG: MATE family efflux transporter [Pseudomonadota bacterium]
MNRNVLTSVFDQIVVSGTMFGLNLLLISAADPGAYGQFILIYSLTLLAFGAQNALVLVPVNVLLPGRSTRRQMATLRMLSTVDLAVVGSAALLVALLARAFGLSWVLCFSAFFLAVTSSWRELARAVCLTRQQPRKLLEVDCSAMAGAVISVAALWQWLEPQTAVLVGLSIGNAVAALMFSPPFFRDPQRIRRSILRYQGYWKKSRWALLGAALTEGQLRLHVFILQLAKGSAALGLVQAGRVLVNPISMIAFAWIRAIRPTIAHHIHARDHQSAMRTIITGTSVLMMFGIVYLIALWLALPHIRLYLSAIQAPAFENLLMLWSLFAIINLPSLCFSVYLQATHRYRDLTACAAASVLASSLLMASLFFDVDLTWAIVALMVGEVVMIAGLIAAIRRDFVRTTQAAGDLHA